MKGKCEIRLEYWNVCCRKPFTFYCILFGCWVVFIVGRNSLSIFFHTILSNVSRHFLFLCGTHFAYSQTLPVFVPSLSFCRSSFLSLLLMWLSVEIKVIKELPWPPPVGQLDSNTVIEESDVNTSLSQQPPSSPHLPSQNSLEDTNGGCKNKKHTSLISLYIYDSCLNSGRFHKSLSISKYLEVFSRILHWNITLCKESCTFIENFLQSFVNMVNILCKENKIHSIFFLNINFY